MSDGRHMPWNREYSTLIALDSTLIAPGSTLILVVSTSPSACEAGDEQRMSSN
jgi:hypothetical protein